jgi:hypothetical protein
MGLGELLDQVRHYYLERLMKAAQQQVSVKNTQVVLEPALRGEDGNPTVEGTLQLPLRKDLAVFQDGVVTKLMTIDTEGMLSFEPVSFDWDDGLQVRLGPFRWQAMPVRMPLRNKTDWQPLQDWFWRWFRKDEDGDGDSFLGAVHFLSDPEASGEKVAFEVDLGSAPVEAFEELLDAVASLGVKQCEVGQVDQYANGE